MEDLLRQVHNKITKLEKENAALLIEKEELESHIKAGMRINKNESDNSYISRLKVALNERNKELHNAYRTIANQKAQIIALKGKRDHK